MLAKLFGPRCLVGVDVGSHAIRVVQVKTGSQPAYQIVKAGGLPTPPAAVEGGQVQDPERLGAAIREALAQAEIRGRQRAALAVPGQVGFIRRVSFPPMPLREIRATIDLQPERYIPFAREGAVYDLHPLPVDPQTGEQPAVLAAAPRQAVEGLMAAARVAGLNPVRIDLEPLTLFRAAVATGQAARRAATGIIDVGHSSARISLFEGDIPVLSRGVEAPPQGTAGAEASTEGFFPDIRRSLEFALTQLREPLSQVLVTGTADDTLALSLTEYLRARLDQRLPGDFTVELLRDADAQVPLSHMLAFGLALPPELFT